MKLKLWTSLIIFLLVSCGSQASQDDVRAAYRLMQKGKVKEFKAMIEDNPSIVNTPYRKTGLLMHVVDTRPAFPNMIATINILLEAGADPNFNAPKLLRKAIWRQDPEIFELLLKYGADPTIISPKKKMNMIEYARSYDDPRFETIIEAWEKEHQ